MFVESVVGSVYFSRFTLVLSFLRGGREHNQVAFANGQRGLESMKFALLVFNFPICLLFPDSDDNKLF